MYFTTAIGLALLANTAFADAADTPRWLTDYAAAQAEARRSQRPILAVLH